MSQAKILWLSDIHYLHNEDFIDKIYKKKINQYFESIRDEIYNKIKPTHIVITGDIVFSAKKEQYDGLYDHILKSYLLDNPKVRLLTCIGNHSVNRDMVKIFTEKFDKVKTNFWKSENRQNFISTSKDDDILNKFLNYQEVKNQLANYSINDLVKEKNLFNLLFIHYIAFYKERVISRIDDINRLNPEEIQILNQDRNECKFGVIHDTKYNLIFVTLNSAYLAWGDETYEELYKDSSKAFSEFGQLTYNNADLKIINNILNDCDNKLLLDENAIIMLAHHPFTWMSYEDQYKSAAFHNILSKIDIALFGHIHVPHHLPTKYRSRTYIFESPQLFDYHLYKLNTNNYHEIGKTLGFNTLTINPNLSKFSRAYYTLKNATESNTEELIKVNPLHFERGNNTPFIWEKTEDGSDSYSLESTKGPIQNIFKLNAKCKGEKNILVDYLKYKSKPSNNRYNYYSKVFDDTDLFVDTDALIGSIYKPESVAHVIDSNVGYLCVQDTKSKTCFIFINYIDREAISKIFDEMYTSFSSFLFCVYDFQLLKNFENDHFENAEYYFGLDFAKAKVDFFSKIDIVKISSTISIEYKTFKFSDYVNHIKIVE